MTELGQILEIKKLHPKVNSIDDIIFQMARNPNSTRDTCSVLHATLGPRTTLTTPHRLVLGSTGSGACIPE